MECERHEHLIIEIEQLKHNVQSNSDKIHNNKDSLDKLGEKITDVGYNRVSDHRDQRNIIDKLGGIDEKLDKIATRFEAKVDNVKDKHENLREEVKNIQSQLAVNDYKTDSNIQNVTEMNKFIRNMSGKDIFKILGLLFSAGVLIITFMQIGAGG